MLENTDGSLFYLLRMLTTALLMTSSHSAGMFEILDLAQAMAIEPIITMSRNQSVEDLGDLVEYAYGDASTEWGKVRIVNDSHPAPYVLTGVELGNEQPGQDWVQQVVEMESRWGKLRAERRIDSGAVGGDSTRAPGAAPARRSKAARPARPASAAATGATSPFYYLWPQNSVSGDALAALQAARVPANKIMADVHVYWGGGLEGIKASLKSAPHDYNITGINCETNGESSGFLRALQEAADLISFENAEPDVYNRAGDINTYCNTEVLLL